MSRKDFLDEVWDNLPIYMMYYSALKHDDADQKDQQKPRISKQNMDKIKEISRDVEANLRGIEAEEKIHSFA